MFSIFSQSLSDAPTQVTFRRRSPLPASVDITEGRLLRPTKSCWVFWTSMIILTGSRDFYKPPLSPGYWSCQERRSAPHTIHLHHPPTVVDVHLTWYHPLSLLLTMGLWKYVPDNNGHGPEADSLLTFFYGLHQLCTGTGLAWNFTNPGFH